jgi:hypothetical protein
VNNKNLSKQKQSSLLENQLQKGSTIAKSLVENFGQDDF